MDGLIVGPKGEEHVQPRVMEVLVYLAEHQGEVVSRRQLIEAVWGHTHVGDEALTRCIHHLRHHLDDHASKPRFIMTVPKRGYELVAPVTVDEDDKAGPVTPRTRKRRKTTSRPRTLRELWDSMSERRVVRVTIAYVAAAWVLLQVIDVFEDLPGLPENLKTTSLVLLTLGFPLVVFVAWAYQVEREDDYMPPAALMIIITLLAVAATAWYLFGPPLEPPACTEVAVMRFENIGGRPDTVFFSDGLSEEIRISLSGVPELRVAGRTDVWSLQGRNLGASEIMESLGLCAVLEGSVRRGMDGIRVSTRLTTLKEDADGATETYDSDPGGVIALARRIGITLVEQLQVPIADAARQALTNQPDIDPQAMEPYLLAREFMREPARVQNRDQARVLFENALAKDPGFANAAAGLCSARTELYELTRAPEHIQGARSACQLAVETGYETMEVKIALSQLSLETGSYLEAENIARDAVSTFPSALQARLQLAQVLAAQGDEEEADAAYRAALDLQEESAKLHGAYATFLYGVDRYEEAAAEYRVALELDPDAPGTLQSLGAALFVLGDFEGAAEAWARAQAIEETWQTYVGLGLLYYYLGRFDESVEMYTAAIRLGYENFRTWGELAGAYALAGNEAEAQAAWQKATDLVERHLEINGQDAEARAFLAFYYAKTGQAAFARRELSIAERLSPDNTEMRFQGALVRVTLDDKEGALADLRRILAEGYSVAIIRAEPELQPLREDGSLDRLLEELAPDRTTN